MSQRLICTICNLDMYDCSCPDRVQRVDAIIQVLFELVAEMPEQQAERVINLTFASIAFEDGVLETEVIQ